MHSERQEGVPLGLPYGRMTSLARRPIPTVHNGVTVAFSAAEPRPRKEERHREQDSGDRRRKKMKGRRKKKEDARDVWELKACVRGEPTNAPRLVADHLPAEGLGRSETSRFMAGRTVAQILERTWRAFYGAQNQCILGKCRSAQSAPTV